MTAPGRRTYLLSLAAVVVFVVSIVVAGVRLAEIEADISRGVPENLVWLSAQGQYEAVRLADAAGRYAIADPDMEADALGLRFDILLSRLAVLQAGAPAEYLHSLGESAALADIAATAALLEEHLTAAQAGKIMSAEALRSGGLALGQDLRDLTNRAMLAERDHAITLQSRRHLLLLELLGYGVGIMASGTVLALSLVRGLRHRAEAEAELARHRDHLEDMVAARTADLRTAEERLVSAIDTAPDGFAAYGPDGRLVHANRHIQTLLPGRPDLFAEAAPLPAVGASMNSLSGQSCCIL